MTKIVIVYGVVLATMLSVALSPLGETTKGVIAAGLTFGLIGFLMRQIRFGD